MSLAVSGISTWSLYKSESLFSCNYYGDARLVMMQEYQLFDTNVICCYSMPSMYITDYKHKRIAIEIKQNKEGMEEKKVKLDKLVTDYTSNKITYKEFEVEVKMLYTDKEGSKPNLKPFDIEAAKAGKPVCTRDGSKARIICFDRCSNKPIVALVTTDDREYLTEYYCDGRISHNSVENNDLMMYPEKKEGWVNVMEGTAGKVYVGNDIYRTEDEAKEGAPRFTSRLIASIPIEWEE